MQRPPLPRAPARYRRTYQAHVLATRIPKITQPPRFMGGEKPRRNQGQLAASPLASPLDPLGKPGALAASQSRRRGSGLQAAMRRASAGPREPARPGDGLGRGLGRGERGFPPSPARRPTVWISPFFLATYPLRSKIKSKKKKLRSR